LKELDLGCGRRKSPHAVGVDIAVDSDADSICDLNKTPYPFKDNSFDKIRAADVLEHLDDVLKVMEELYRISKPGAKINIASPHFTSHNFYTDFTHKRAFGVRSFDFFSSQPSTLVKYMPTKARFKIIKKLIEPNPFVFTFGDKIKKIPNVPLRCIINLNAFTQDIYERFFAFIFTSEGVHFELEVIKD